MWYLICAKHIPKSCRILSVDALPSNVTDPQKSCGQSCRHSAPSITTFILPTRPWTTPKVCATVIRASSWVNRSNLWSTDSISLSPNSFFANFSVAHWDAVSIYVTACLLNRPWLICFVARASTESNSTIILMMISVIIEVGGIVV